MTEPEPMPTHAWCDLCKAIRQVDTDSLATEDVTGQYLGADIVCRTCFYIVATIYRPKVAA